MPSVEIQRSASAVSSSQNWELATPGHSGRRWLPRRDRQLVNSREIKLPGSGRLGRRLFDLFGSAALILFTSPILLTLFFLVRRDGGAAIFAHERVGRNGRPFKCYKFRSMYENADDILEQHLQSDDAARQEWAERQKLTMDPRVTPIGSFLRRSSLDELPQLFNVFAGEMSLIGPRPITRRELARYGCRQDIYLRCMPGMTGLWQVSGRSNTTYRRRVALDTTYAKKASIGLDFMILSKTILVILRQNGAE